MFSEVGHDVNASRKTSNAWTFLSFIFGLAFLNFFFFVFRVMKHRYLVIWSHIVSWRLLLLTRLKFAISSFSSLFICPTGLLIAFVFCCLLENAVDADEIRRLGKRFRKLDLDKSGALSVEEFMSLPELQQNPLVQRVIEIFDTDGNGEVDFKG